MKSVLAVAAIALAVPAAAQVPLPMAGVVPEGAVLDVSATGRVTRTPDVATVRAGVVTHAATAAAALADNAQAMAGVLRTLKTAGISPRDLATSIVSLQPQYRYAENQPPAITGYQASNAVTVKFRDIARSGTVLDALARSGANQIDGPAMSLAEPDAALDAARADAVTRARARAELYARTAGLRVERIVAINEANENGGDHLPPPGVRMSAMRSAGDAATVVLPGETDVTATLNVRFLLK